MNNAIKKRVRYDVYKNLHNGMWSIRDSESKLVVGHAKALELVEAELKVSEAGRQRVIRERKKNVHAFIRGIAVNVQGFVPFKDRVLHDNVCIEPRERNAEWHRVTYNPYTMDTFQVRLGKEDIGEPVDHLPSVYLSKYDGAWGRLVDVYAEKEDAQ